LPLGGGADRDDQENHLDEIQAPWICRDPARAVVESWRWRGDDSGELEAQV